MIKGMTGYGSAQVSTSNTKAVIEVKSVNHKYLDINYYLPIGFGVIESKIKEIIESKFERGRVTVSLKLIEKPPHDIILNKDAVNKYLLHASKLKKEFNLENDLTLSNLISLPGVFEAKEVLVDAEKFWPVLEKGLKKALNGLSSMRNAEGKSLFADLSDKSKKMTLQIKSIQSRASQILAAKRKTLTEEETVSFQKSIDVNEELIRMTHYIDELKLLIRAKASVGKKIDFLAQEMQRETNTIGSKIQDKIITNAVISIKSKIDKIREQAQNVE